MYGPQGVEMMAQMCLHDFCWKKVTLHMMFLAVLFYFLMLCFFLSFFCFFSQGWEDVLCKDLFVCALELGFIRFCVSSVGLGCLDSTF
ncbi:hypothetical protein V8C34DRAFT_273506, partial [Trichoderma compactum]